MEYQKFLSDWKDGLIEIDVSQSKALQVANSSILPIRY